MFIVPEPRANHFRAKFDNHAEVTAEAAKYYALYHRDPSWKELAIGLYTAGEAEAAEMAKHHVQTVTGT